MNRNLFPPIEPYSSFQLPVSSIHTLYVEESGNPRGMPIVFVHGGPGGGIEAKHRQYFNKDKWRVILFDQRGCGRSAPYGELRENSTFDLIKDMEKIRTHLGIDRWHVFGGSWGSTLSLAYAISHPECVLGLILRGIFLLRRKEIQWFYQYGASEIFPEAWDSFLVPIAEHERHDLLGAYYRILTGKNTQLMQEAAIAWSTWEGATSKLLPDQSMIAHFGQPEFALAFARIESHYFYHGGFFENDNWILENIGRIRKIPGVIVQGRYDMPCPVRSAYELHKAWPEAQFQVIPDAGHSAGEPGIISALVDATDGMG